MNQELNLFELVPLKLRGPDAKEFQNKTTNCLDTIPLCMACPTYAIMRKDFKPGTALAMQHGSVMKIWTTEVGAARLEKGPG